MASDPTPIEGKVARVLNSRELAINVGTKHGVRVGMLFDVLDQTGEDIRDPDTDELLGSILRPKVRVRVTSVQEGLSVASTYRTTKINVGGHGLGDVGLSRIFQPERWVQKYETLKTDEKTWEHLDESESFVKTGDPVRQVTDSDDASAGTAG